jgi:hypothetical protein
MFDCHTPAANRMNLNRVKKISIPGIKDFNIKINMNDVRVSVRERSSQYQYVLTQPHQQESEQ